MIDNRTELEEKFQWDGEKHLELINYLMSKFLFQITTIHTHKSSNTFLRNRNLQFAGQITDIRFRN